MNERPDIKQIKAELAAAIVRLIDEQQLTDMAASERLTLAPTEIARIRARDLASFSIDHLIAVLNAFDQRVEVTISPGAVEWEATKPDTDERASGGNPLLEIIQYMEELHAKIPSEELDKVPTDLAANHDHYLYGAKKRS